MSEPTQVRDLLTSLLDEAVLALATTDGAEVAPERTYVAHGIVTANYQQEGRSVAAVPQLTTHLVRITPKLIDPKQNQCLVIMVATMAVTLLRCIPTVQSPAVQPSAEELNMSSLQLLIDGPAIQKHLTRAWVEGSWPVGLLCKSVRWGALEPMPPAGGLAGWRIAVDVDLT